MKGNSNIREGNIFISKLIYQTQKVNIENVLFSCIPCQRSWSYRTINEREALVSKH